MVLELARQRLEIFVAADFRVQLSVVSDVVSMRAARPGFQNRRRIEMRDPQRVEVADQGPGFAKAKPCIELHPISSGRSRSPALRHQSLQAFGNAAQFLGDDGGIRSHKVGDFEGTTSTRLRCGIAAWVGRTSGISGVRFGRAPVGNSCNACCGLDYKPYNGPSKALGSLSVVHWRW